MTATDYEKIVDIFFEGVFVIFLSYKVNILGALVNVF